jgi:predicted ATPase
LFSQGEIARALVHANEAIALNNPDTQQEHIRSFGYDGRVINLTGAAWSLWCLGYPEQALARMKEALAIARELAHPYSMTMALYTGAWLHVFRREPGPARAHAEQAIAVSVEHGFAWPHAFALPLEGWALAEEGRTVDGVGKIRAGLAALDQMGHRLWRPHQQGMLAAALARSGRTEEAQSTLRAALDSAERTGDMEHAAELHRQMGELALRTAGPDGEPQAERHFGEAIRIARGQQAKSWELRAIVSLARLWRDKGEREKARELLAPVYAWFTEGFDTQDLRDAKALRDELG